MTKPTINGHYDPEKLNESWTRQREGYTQCPVYRLCKLATQRELCLDSSNNCEHRKKLEEQLIESLDLRGR